MKTIILFIIVGTGIAMTMPAVLALIDPPMDFQPYTRYYEDLDQDGYGNPLRVIHASFQPKGYVTIDGDCNDNDNKIKSDYLFTFYADADGDGIGSSLHSIRACAQPIGYVIPCCDCDDQDPTQGKGQLLAFLRDLDGDGLGDQNFIKQACTQPKGYVLLKSFDESDCDDNDPKVGNGKLNIVFPDEDHDGFGNGGEKRFFCFIPKGWVLDRSDCDDHNPKIGSGEKQIFYKDNDNDGYGNSQVLVYSCDEPKGFVREGNDCNDNDKNIGPGKFNYYYEDLDLDGLGNSNRFAYTCLAPKGYVKNYDDCDDTNAKIGGTHLYFLDQDQDGYGGSTIQIACSPSAGYVGIKGDCDDGNAKIFPGSAEICNGLDDNCDGTIDEGYPKVTIDYIPTHICYNSKPIALSGHPKGGVFTLDGKIITEIDPSKYGINLYKLLYTVQTENCLVTVNTFFKISSLKPLEIYGHKESYVQNDIGQILRGNYDSGKFYLDGLETNYISPARLDLGYHTLTYIVNEFGCTEQITKTFQVTVVPVCPFTPIDIQCYKIINKKSGKALTVRKGSQLDGMYTTQSEFQNLDHQKWIIYQHLDQSYSIIAAHSFKEIESVGSFLGSIVVQNQFTAHYPSGSWNIQCTNNTGYYHFVNVQNQNVMDVMARSNAEGAQIITWYPTNLDNQLWAIIPVDCNNYQSARIEENIVKRNKPNYQDGLEIELYPNPANDYLFIKSNIGSIKRMTIYDQLGKVILINQWSVLRDEFIQDLHREKIIPGMYLIQIEAGMEIISKKIIVK